MAIINKLFSLYEGQGFTVSSGLSPSHSNGAVEAPFTWLFKDAKSHTNGLGISMKEVYFLECLFEGFHPGSAFIIGNSFGWSTLAVALLNPNARIVAIDAGFDQNSLDGLGMTNALARSQGLNVSALQAVSPADVPHVVETEIGGAIDFCFIDGLHTNSQVVLDFSAVQPFLAPGALILFHDVVLWNMQPGMVEIAKLAGRTPETLYATCSGMAALYLGDDPGVRRTLATFRGDPAARDLIARLPGQRKHRHIHRWRRSIGKRLASLRRAVP